MVGGSDLVKQREQLGEGVLGLFDYVFPENGLMAYKAGALIGQTSFREHLGEARLKEFINFTLAYLSTVDIPVKRGTFIEFRSGMLNVSPIGRNCSQEERDAFEVYDKEHGVRATMVRVLQERFASFGLKYSIGGQISFDVFPLVRLFRARAPVPLNPPPPSATPRGLPPPPSPFSPQRSRTRTRTRARPMRRAGTRRTACATWRARPSRRCTFLGTRPSRAAMTMRSSPRPTSRATP